MNYDADLSKRPTLSDRLQILSATLMRCRESSPPYLRMKWHGEVFEEEGGSADIRRGGAVPEVSV